MIRRPPRSTQSRSSAASDVYKRQDIASFDLLVMSAMMIRPQLSLALRSWYIQAIMKVSVCHRLRHLRVAHRLFQQITLLFPKLLVGLGLCLIVLMLTDIEKK